jgi:hypothetical protein
MHVHTDGDGQEYNLTVHIRPVLWNRNDLLRFRLKKLFLFRFRIKTIFSSFLTTKNVHKNLAFSLHHGFPEGWLFF